MTEQEKKNTLILFEYFELVAQEIEAKSRGLKNYPDFTPEQKECQRVALDWSASVVRERTSQLRSTFVKTLK